MPNLQFLSMMPLVYQFHYRFSGNSNQPLIVFLHGFMGNCHEFDTAISLSQHFYCLTVDLPGHGKTQVLDSDEYYTIPNTAQGIINLLDTLNISQCFLVGYSMGGRLALYLTLHFPERFPQVVLESASPGLASEIERLERVKCDNQIAQKLTRISHNQNKDFAAFLSTWYSQPIFGNIKNHPQFGQLITSRLENNPSQLAKSLRWMGTGTQPSLWEQIKGLQQPILLLVGEYDHKFLDINRKMVDISKFCQLKIIPNAAHNIHFENSQVFVENINNLGLTQ
jgi:2-succinyl-6-hydroxy-2,4-cyclohexadiene-1-carboxylate synthase